MSVISKLDVRNVRFVLPNAAQLLQFICCFRFRFRDHFGEEKSVASVISFGNNWQEKQFSQLLIFLMVCLFY